MKDEPRKIPITPDGPGGLVHISRTVGRMQEQAYFEALRAINGASDSRTVSRETALGQLRALARFSVQPGIRAAAARRIALDRQAAIRGPGR